MNRQHFLPVYRFIFAAHLLLRIYSLGILWARRKGPEIGPLKQFLGGSH